MIQLEIAYEPRGLKYPPKRDETVIGSLHRTVFFAQEDTPVKVNVVQVVPLGMKFDMQVLRGYVFMPMYVTNTINLSSSLMELHDQVCVALLERPISNQLDEFSDVTIVKAGQPLIAVHTLDPIHFKEGIL